jgi:hypothetical protein
MDNNNNKRQNDGRTNNVRRERVKIIKNTTNTTPAINTAKKNRSKKLSKKAISNIFGSEDGVWDSLAKMAQEGNVKAMEMLLQYQYGKAGEQTEQRAVSNKAPIIQFNMQNEEKVIDITEDE